MGRVSQSTPQNGQGCWKVIEPPHKFTSSTRFSMVDPNGGRFMYLYDSLNRITRVKNPQNELTTYQYDAAGRRTVKKQANGTRASFTYDAGWPGQGLAGSRSDKKLCIRRSARV